MILIPHLNLLSLFIQMYRDDWKHTDGYLFLNAQALMSPYIGKVLLLSPIGGEFSNEDNGTGFIPPHSGRQAQLAEKGTYPIPQRCEIHVGELDWQSNPANVTKLAGLLGLTATVVPGGGHILDKRYVSAALDRWLDPYSADNVAQE